MNFLKNPPASLSWCKACNKASIRCPPIKSDSSEHLDSDLTDPAVYGRCRPCPCGESDLFAPGIADVGRAVDEPERGADEVGRDDVLADDTGRDDSAVDGL